MRFTPKCAPISDVYEHTTRLVIGTTNRLDIIDAALLRPSRFQAITIGLPDMAARRAIAAVHARRFQMEVAPELLDLVADMTGGCNGDEIRSLFRDACVGLYCEKSTATRRCSAVRGTGGAAATGGGTAVARRWFALKAKFPRSVSRFDHDHRSGQIRM